MYWNKKNKSNLYSLKLNKLLIEATELLASHPLTGRSTNIQNVRVKIIRDFLMVYSFTDTDIQILAIFDTRQNPDIFEDIVLSAL